MRVEVKVDGADWQWVDITIAETEYSRQLDEIDQLLQAMYPNSDLAVRNIEE